ncbi:MAG: type II toxin-antitoxin system PemK/MazF family toxin, partial [Thermoguttaceae bacterium]
LPQAGDGPAKLRPALVLSELPGPYQNMLICGISTRLQDLQSDWDELVNPGEVDFAASGLHRVSAIRLSYLYAAESTELSGVIGRISKERLLRLLKRLAVFLQKSCKN